MTRELLPNRRAHELFEFESMGLRFTASVSHHVDGQPVCELRIKLPACGRALGPCEGVIDRRRSSPSLHQMRMHRAISDKGE